MKVHILILHTGYETWDIIGVFTTKGGARKAARRVWDSRYAEWNRLKDLDIRTLTVEP
jgi:hypothetical protein